MTHDPDGATIGGATHESSIVGQSPVPREFDFAALLRAHAANLLSLARLAMAGVWVLRFTTNPADHAMLGTIAILAALTDFFDGRLARLLATASGSGRWLDNAADIVFVLAALSCEVSASAIPAYIPILIGVSFTQYVGDSLIVGRRRTGPIPSRLGHWGGIVNYALVLALSFAPAPAAAGNIVRAGAPILAAFYLGAIAERAALLYRGRR